MLYRANIIAYISVHPKSAVYFLLTSEVIYNVNCEKFSDLPSKNSFLLVSFMAE